MAMTQELFISISSALATITYAQSTNIIKILTILLRHHKKIDRKPKKPIFGIPGTFEQISLISIPTTEVYQNPIFNLLLFSFRWVGRLINYFIHQTLYHPKCHPQGIVELEKIFVTQKTNYLC